MLFGVVFAIVLVAPLVARTVHSPSKSIDQAPGLLIEINPLKSDQLNAYYNGIHVIEHSKKTQFVYVGSGKTKYKSHYGNFEIDDYLEERFGLNHVDVVEQNQKTVVMRFGRHALSLQVTLTVEDDVLTVAFGQLPPGMNRLWFRIKADGEEKVYGAGEQFSYFNMRGKNFPIWTREQGVGRNKSTYATFQADNNDGGGGDYHTTYWAQPTFVSSKKYFFHSTASSYVELDFKRKEFHEIMIWNTNPGEVKIGTAKSFAGLVSKLTGIIGRQPMLPDWMHTGSILGVQGGTASMLKYLKQAQDQGVSVNGLWIQDWVGRIRTSFGRRLFWNWKWDEKQYPNLPNEILKLKEKGVAVLGYINPNLNVEGDLFKEGNQYGYFVKNSSGDTYITDFGEFFCGTIDLTNPDAYTWYKDEVIKKNMIDLGLSGWMADFGEYLPTDSVFFNGQSGLVMHNIWPALWAKINFEAVSEAGKLGEVMYWMRAGYTGSQKYNTLTWAGDQLVDWSLDDGLASVIPAALSLGLSGHGLHHFDIGGYTSLFGITRTEELLLRYAEFAAFTPVMRTHEGNRPSQNWQVYSCNHTLQAFARLTKIFVLLSNYTRELVKENSESGIPTQRPLFMHYENCSKCYDIKYQYMYGPDLLVAPVFEPDRETWTLFLPEDQWIFLWDGKLYQGGKTYQVDALMGNTPVFYRQHSKWASVFKKIGLLKNTRSKQVHEEL
ncbi:sulfoquinovosidase-like [Antedon mediterranea]|uniref:sulfoquinovosidase-like n=1 Tax=Antedon mediterranea TaxID=105859 RepID=UPI003AF535AD